MKSDASHETFVPLIFMTMLSSVYCLSIVSEKTSPPPPIRPELFGALYTELSRAGSPYQST